MYGAFKTVITRAEEAPIAGNPMQLLKLANTPLQCMPKVPNKKNHETPRTAQTPENYKWLESLIEKLLRHAFRECDLD
jgi:hypothetical protein